MQKTLYTLLLAFLITGLSKPAHREIVHEVVGVNIFRNLGLTQTLTAATNVPCALQRHRRKAVERPLWRGETRVTRGGLGSGSLPRVDRPLRGH